MRDYTVYHVNTKPNENGKKSIVGPGVYFMEINDQWSKAELQQIVINLNVAFNCGIEASQKRIKEAINIT